MATLGLLAVACGGGGTSKVGGQTLSLTGRVLDADNQKPIDGADVTAPDGTGTKTDKKGAFSLDYKEKKGGQVQAKATTAAPVTKPVPAGKGYLELSVKHYDAEKEIDAKTGGEVKAKSGAAVKIPGAELAYKDGSAAVGKAEIALASPDPSKAHALDSVPGNFDGRKGEVRGKVSVDTPVYVTAHVSEKELELKGKASLSLPVRKHPPTKAAAVALYRYSDDEALWVPGGTATRTTNTDGVEVYVGEIDALGWWTVGTFFETVSCVRGCVEDMDGKPASFVQVSATGVDTFSQAVGFAGEDGCYAFDLPAGQRFDMRALSAAGRAYLGLVSTNENASSAEKNPSACKKIPNARFGGSGDGGGVDAATPDGAVSADAGPGADASAFPFPGFPSCQGADAGASGCTQAEERAYANCLLSACGKQYDAAYGSGGACASWTQCFAQCNCSDSACVVGCGAPSNACVNALQNWSLCQEKNCPAPACAGGSGADAGTTPPPDASVILPPDSGVSQACVDLANCCGTLTDAAQIQSCATDVQKYAPSNTSGCAAALTSYCPGK